MSEQIEQLSSAAEDAKQKLDDITSSKEELEGM
jgi:hypothetical protein